MAIRDASPLPLVEEHEARASLGMLVFRVGQLMGTLIERALADAGISPREYAILSLIHDAGPTAPTALARRAGMPLTTLSDQLPRYLERGLLRRIPNPSDGRSYLLELTDRGREAHRAARVPFSALMSRVEGELGEGSGEARAGLERLVAALHRLDGRETEDGARDGAAGRSRTE